MKTWSTKTVGAALGSAGLAAAAGLTLVGCDVAKDILEGGLGTIAAPGATFNDVDLVEHPSAKQMARWGCNEILGFSSLTCGAIGLDPVDKSEMQFSFNVIFDLTNNNEKIPIPLVEILMATTVYESENLGSVCISFCDPEDESCEPEANAEGACDAEDAQDVSSVGDIVPTVDQLHDIAQNVVMNGVDNGDFRVIPAQDKIEAHILFDFDIGKMLGILDDVFFDLYDDFEEGRSLSVDIPYTMDGSLFFNVPEMGRYAAGFGPIENTWEF
jgi:hypothetical protein